MNDVCAIIVTYHPDASKLARLVELISDQVRKLEIVDNSIDNVGLAAALNRGIATADQEGYEYVLLLDQDSSPAPDMVAALVDDFRAAEKGGRRVAAIGPSPFDTRNGRAYPFVRIGFPNNTSFVPAHLEECDFLITSGCLIPLQVLRGVGLMDAGLFIDNVDLEWCFRARRAGYSVLGSVRARMGHEIGDKLIPIPGMRHKQILVHSPVRLYYIMRNRLLLYWMPHVPLIWKAQDILRIPIKLLIFSVFYPPRKENFRHMMRGLWHGLTRRSGPIGR